MATYKYYLMLHIAAGTLALVSFWLAAALRKGSPRHRLVGQAYLFAMVVVIVSGMPLVIQRVIDGQPVMAAFLAYLLVITATGVWKGWRSIRDKHDVVRYTGPVYVGFAVLCLGSGLGILALGLRVGAPLLVGFSLIGGLFGVGMLRKRRHRERLGARPRWWLVEHYSAMLGNGIATHVAFLSLGLPRLLPSIDGTMLHYMGWFGPVLVALVAKLVIDRQWKPKPRVRPKASAPAVG